MSCQKLALEREVALEAARGVAGVATKIVVNAASTRTAVDVTEEDIDVLGENGVDTTAQSGEQGI